MTTSYIGRLIIRCAMLACLPFVGHAQHPLPPLPNLPLQIESGPQGRHHVQGIAYDEAGGCIYMSFTTSLVKLDLQGRLLGSVVGLTGHLGCLAFNPDDRCIYGSLEYKHDVIGKGLQDGVDPNQIDKGNGFYVAIFNADLITRRMMPASEVMKTVYLKEVVRDFEDSVTNQGIRVAHRYGCSGIDGLTLAPAWGQAEGRRLLYVAYGVYGDLSRTDNDYQVILCYDPRRWDKYARPLSQQHLHHSGPARPKAKYFLRTGNTSWGIQNLEYDPSSGHFIAAAYPGKKAGWPNYSLFAINGQESPCRQKLMGFDQKTTGEVLQLLPAGTHDKATDTWGWHLPYGSTGICALGNGYFYISHNKRGHGLESCTLHLYHWDGMDWRMISPSDNR